MLADQPLGLGSASAAALAGSAADIPVPPSWYAAAQTPDRRPTGSTGSPKVYGVFPPGFSSGLLPLDPKLRQQQAFNERVVSRIGATDAGLAQLRSDLDDLRQRVVGVQTDQRALKEAAQA